MEKGLKEFYKLRLKAIQPITIKDRTIQPGETIVFFDTVLALGMEGIVAPRVARGGQGNSAEIIWDDISEIMIQFSKGTLNKESFSVMANSCYYKSDATESIEITETEFAESDEDCLIELKYDPVTAFVRERDSGKALSFVKNGEKTLEIENPYVDVIVDYTFLYSKTKTCYDIGQELYRSFVELESRVRLKDDETGLTTTGIIKIPKFKVMSDLSVAVGIASSPVVGNFGGIAYRTGRGGDARIATIQLLNEDIDTEI